MYVLFFLVFFTESPMCPSLYDTYIHTYEYTYLRCYCAHLPMTYLFDSSSYMNMHCIVRMCTELVYGLITTGVGHENVTIW